MIKNLEEVTMESAIESFQPIITTYATFYPALSEWISNTDELEKGKGKTSFYLYIKKRQEKIR